MPAQALAPPPLVSHLSWKHCSPSTPSTMLPIGSLGRFGPLLLLSLLSACSAIVAMALLCGFKCCGDHLVVALVLTGAKPLLEGRQVTREVTTRDRSDNLMMMGSESRGGSGLGTYLLVVCRAAGRQVNRWAARRLLTTLRTDDTPQAAPVPHDQSR